MSGKEASLSLPNHDTLPTLNRRRFAASALAGVAAVGCVSSISRPALAQATPPLRVAVLLPRSGFYAQIGQACQRGADLAVPILAARGIAVELMSVDVESTADVARTRAELAIKDGAHVIVGAFDSGLTTAIAQVCEQQGVPLVVNIAAAPQLTDQGYRTLVRNFPTSVDLMRNGLSLMRDLLRSKGQGPSSAVLLYANDTFGQANKAAFDAIYPGLGIPVRIADAISYDPRAQSLAVEVQKARATGAELVLCFTRAGDAIQLVREMVRQRWEPKGLISPGSPGFYDEQFYKAVGRYGDYVMTNLPWYQEKNPLVEEISIEFKKRWPNDKFAYYGFNIGFTFDAVMVAADAYRRAGSVDRAALVSAIRATNLVEHVIAGGPITFDQTGQNRSISSVTVQNQNELPTVVFPKELAAADPVFPMPSWQGRG